MYVERVRLKNIRCIESLDITLLEKAGWIVLTGPNGTGKTTLLQSIAATILGPSNAVVMMERADEFVRAGAEDGRTDVWVDGSGAEDWRAASDVRGPVRLGVTWGRDASARAYPPRGNHAFVVNQLWEGAGFGARPRGWCLAAYGASRRTGPPSAFGAELMAAPPRRSSVVTLFRGDTSLMAANTWVRDIGRGPAEQLPAYLMKTGLLGALLGDGLLSVDGSPVAVTMRSTGAIIVHRPEGDLSLASLGAGFESLALVVIDIVRQMSAFYGDAFMEGADWPVPKGQTVQVPHSGVVLIDEIDNHLHPRFQQRIGGWLKDRFPRVQFIVTTHSPAICTVADGLYVMMAPGKIARMDRDAFLRGDFGGADHFAFNSSEGV